MNRKQRRADPARFLNEGVQQFQAGNLDLAQRAIDKALKISPDNADALYLGALCRHAQGQHGHGARLMSAAVAKGLADHPEPLNNAGQVLKAGGRLDEAVQVYRRALRVAPNEPSIHVNLGNALAGLDDQEDAITAYETAIRLNPGTVAAYVNLAGLLKDLERYPEAENCLDRVLVIAPGHPDALATLSGGVMPYFLSTALASASVLVSATVGPEAMTSGSSPGTSEMRNA